MIRRRPKKSCRLLFLCEKSLIKALHLQRIHIRHKKISTISKKVLAFSLPARYTIDCSRGRSSAGRAPGSQSGGRGFKPLRLHHIGKDRPLYDGTAVFWFASFVRRKLTKVRYLSHTASTCRFSLLIDPSHQNKSLCVPVLEAVSTSSSCFTA